MEENDNQELDLEAEELEVQPEEQPSETETVAKKDYLTEIARKKHWREKFEKEAQARKELEAKLPKTQSEQKPDPSAELTKTVESLKMSERKRDFGDEHSLSKPEVDEVFAYASGKGVDPTVLMKEKDKYPGLTGLLTAVKQQRRAADNTPLPSSDVPTFQGKTFDELDLKGKQDNWSTLVQSKVKK